MSKIIIPANYTPALNLYDTQRAIGTVKRLFADTLCATLNLYRVSAPLFVEASTGLNDDLNGVERKVTFDTKDSGIEVQVVQSLAKWKRKALKVSLIHIFAGISVGTLVSLGSVLALALAMGLTREQYATLLPLSLIHISASGRRRTQP